jgi:hypothetical protein
MKLPWVSLPKCRPCSRAAEDGHGAESSFTGPEPEDLPPQPLWSPRWICSLCRRSVSGSSMRSLILHHDVDASYQWRSHPIRRPNGLHGRSPKPFPGKRHRNTCFATARPSMGTSSGNGSPPWASAIGPLPLGRLWRDQGKRTEARDLLAPSTAGSPTCFDTPDLKEAKALLEELTKAPVVLCRSQQRPPKLLHSTNARYRCYLAISACLLRHRRQPERRSRLRQPCRRLRLFRRCTRQRP